MKLLVSEYGCPVVKIIWNPDPHTWEENWHSIKMDGEPGEIYSGPIYEIDIPYRADMLGEPVRQAS